MILSALVKVNKNRPYSVETIICFDTCLFCGTIRHKSIGISILTKKGLLSTHTISCNCEPVINHSELDEEHMIIYMLNDLNVVCEIELKP